MTRKEREIVESVARDLDYIADIFGYDPYAAETADETIHIMQEKAKEALAKLKGVLS